MEKLQDEAERQEVPGHTGGYLTTVLFFQVMGYHGIGTVLYLTAFISNAATVDDFFPSLFYEHLAAASVRHY